MFRVSPDKDLVGGEGLSGGGKKGGEDIRLWKGHRGARTAASL